MATHSSILAWKIPWTEEHGGLQSMGSQRVRHGWATNTYLLTIQYNVLMGVTSFLLCCVLLIINKVEFPSLLKARVIHKPVDHEGCSLRYPSFLCVSSELMCNYLQSHGLQFARSSSHGIFQAWILGCHFLLQGIFQTQDQTWVSCIGRWILHHWATPEVLARKHGGWDGTGVWQEELPYIQGEEQGLCFAGAAVKRYPTSKVRETQVTWEALREGIRGQIDRSHNHWQLANLITWTTALSNSVKLSHALWGCPRWTGHGGEVWQNVVHWRREWQTTSVVWAVWTVWKGKKIRHWKMNSPGR